MSPEVLVQFRPGVSRLERRRVVEALGCRLRKEIEAQRIAVAVLPTGTDPAEMVRRFLAMEGVAYAEADQPVQTDLKLVSKLQCHSRESGNPRSSRGQRLTGVEDPRFREGLPSTRSRDAGFETGT